MTVSPPSAETRSRGVEPRKGLRARWPGRVMLAGIVLLLVQGWLVDGLAPPMEIDSGSMAPALLGPHVVLRCPRCGHRFPADVEAVPTGEVTCANCGALARRDPSQDATAGDRVMVDRTAFCFRTPKRWEPVVFRHPVTGQWTVKRVVGLPGETISLRGGEVWADGRLLVKPMAALRALATLVTDSRSTPLGSAFSRWTPAVEPPVPITPGIDGVQWMVFRAGGSVPFSADGPPPITDALGYNGTMPRRAETVGPVGDLLLEVDVPARCRKGRLVLFARRVGEIGVVMIDLDRERWQISFHGRPLSAARRWPAGRREHSLRVALADGRYRVTLDENLLADCASRRPLNPYNVEWDAPLAIGFRGIDPSELVVRVYRDVRYLVPPGQGECVEAAASLGLREYFVLGDNSPASEDSRNWSARPGVPEESLVGGVVRPVGNRPE